MPYGAIKHGYKTSKGGGLGRCLASDISLGAGDANVLEDDGVAQMPVQP